MKERKLDRKGSGMKLLLGAAAGLAIGYWLNSDNGRTWRKKAANKTAELNENISKTASEQISKVRSKVHTAVDTSKEYLGKITDKAMDLANKYGNYTEEVLDETESAFERGAQNAKKKIHSKG